MGVSFVVDAEEITEEIEKVASESISEEDLARFYRQGEPALLIFTEAEEVGKLRAEIEERNRQLQTLVNGLTAENLQLKARIAKAEKTLAQLEEKLNRLIQTSKGELMVMRGRNLTIFPIILIAAIFLRLLPALWLPQRRHVFPCAVGKATPRVWAFIRSRPIKLGA
jgi:hypothetical protein